MTQHVRILGVLHLVFGAVGLFAACLVFLVFGGIAGIVGMNAGDADARIAAPILLALGTFLFGLIGVLSLPQLICGMGLLRFREWARILGIVLSAVSLLNVPFGTVLGGYGLWVLLAEQTQRLFRSGLHAAR